MTKKTIKTKYGFMYRGNEYGWWSAEVALKKALEKATWEYPYVMLWISLDGGKTPFKAIGQIRKR